MVTAKFKVSRVTFLGADNLEEAYAAEVELTPDYAGGANKAWSEATPSGVCRLTITNKSAVKQFPQGASMTITFEQDDVLQPATARPSRPDPRRSRSAAQ